MKRYKYEEWHIGENHYDYDLNIYVDDEGKPITGILEDFKFYKKGDVRNDQYVENGKRKFLDADI